MGHPPYRSGFRLWCIWASSIHTRLVALSSILARDAVPTHSQRIRNAVGVRAIGDDHRIVDSDGYFMPAYRDGCEVIFVRGDQASLRADPLVIQPNSCLPTRAFENRERHVFHANPRALEYRGDTTRRRHNAAAAVKGTALLRCQLLCRLYTSRVRTSCGRKAKEPKAFLC